MICAALRQEVHYVMKFGKKCVMYRIAGESGLDAKLWLKQAMCVIAGNSGPDAQSWLPWADCGVAGERRLDDELQLTWLSCGDMDGVGSELSCSKQYTDNYEVNHNIN